MEGLDTNVLVRYLTLDHAEQSARATEEIERAADRGKLLFTTDVVLCELVWVLDRAYGYTRAEIVRALEGLLRAAQLRFSDPAVLWGAWADYREGPADFSDYLVGRKGIEAGCATTVTFDQSLDGAPGFTLL